MRYICLFLILIPFLGQGQNVAFSQADGFNSGKKGGSVQKIPGTVVHANVLNGDTIPVITLKEVSIATARVWPTAAEQKKWERLKKKVKKVYPYAQLARLKMEVLEKEIEGLDKRKDQKQYIKKAEKELFAEFEGEIKDMTVSEGVILIKLIDRETGDSSFDLVKDLKGSFNAFMWQSVARIFGHNLKSKYDPKGEDMMIEEIVLMIQRGDL